MNWRFPQVIERKTSSGSSVRDIVPCSSTFLEMPSLLNYSSRLPKLGNAGLLSGTANIENPCTGNDDTGMVVIGNAFDPVF